MSGVSILASDDKYREWVLEHPEGFVINVRRQLSPDYVVLHRARCVDLAPDRYSPGALTERGYRKIGADYEVDLLVWVAASIPGARGFTRRCSRCRA